VPSRVTTNVANYRRSRVVDRPGDLADGLVTFVRERLPELCAGLDVVPFPVGRIEAQLTVHSEGDYFHVHTDNGDDETRTRVLSYVYYFHRQPKRFTGGELVLFDTWRDQARSTEVGPPVVIEPVDDSLVVFSSSCLHEVRAVQMLSDDPEDGRFTVNGWVRRSDEVS
jgi:Rps23 Pro-64 3,4-dihydroxylase Tpa1-like proline 4-hydroxylase